MAWRTVVITNPARLRVENSQLLVIQDEIIPLPIEDIGVLILESPEVILSSSLLYRLAEHDVFLIVCDESHLPCLAGLPFAGHCRLTGIQRMQLDLSVPFKKRCWQAIIRQKIANQAECLRLTGNGDKAARLSAMLGDITSGDFTNVESRAAREHFKFMFGPDFIRGEEDTTNAGLNYGYAVVRAGVARALAAHGFLLSQGLHHRSELNPFNLADDFIEPLRPLVDLCVARHIPEDSEFSREHRAMLVSMLHSEILIDGKRHSALRAADIMVASFMTACRDKNPGLLKLPKLLPLKQHCYE